MSVTMNGNTFATWEDVRKEMFTPEEIAEVIAPQFAETELETITAIVRRYYEQDTWKENLIFEEESFDLLQEILEQAGELEKKAPYKTLVTTKYAEEAAAKG